MAAMTEEMKTQNDEQEEMLNETQPETNDNLTADSSINQDNQKNAEDQAEDHQINEDNANDKTVELTEKIAELEEKMKESENRYLRLYADFENFRRRTQIDREASEKYRAQELITNLLPAIDNFERALEIEPANEQAKAVLDGVEMVYRGIIDALKTEGAEQIEAVGKEFDPNFHQAVMQTQDENYGPNIVVEELQKGYILKDRVIRPSMVKVNQ